MIELPYTGQHEIRCQLLHNLEAAWPLQHDGVLWDREVGLDGFKERKDDKIFEFLKELYPNYKGDVFCVTYFDGNVPSYRYFFGQRKVH